MDRTDAARHIAKVFAYLACGNRTAARSHAAVLIAWLQSL